VIQDGVGSRNLEDQGWLPSKLDPVSWATLPPLTSRPRAQDPDPCEGACINNRANFGPQDEPILRSATLDLYFTFRKNRLYTPRVDPTGRSTTLVVLRRLRPGRLSAPSAGSLARGGAAQGPHHRGLNGTHPRAGACKRSCARATRILPDGLGAAG